MGLIMEHSHVNYPERYEIVTDGRVLNALVRRGLINEWDKTHKYINDYDETEIIYNNDTYIVKYFEGCFSPFVCKVLITSVDELYNELCDEMLKLNDKMNKNDIVDEFYNSDEIVRWTINNNINLNNKGDK